MSKVKNLQLWCKKMADGYRDVEVRDMAASWKSGLAFCAIIHRFRPDLIDYDSLSKENIFENNQLAFDVGQNQLKIPAFLDAADMVAIRVPDSLSVITYVSQYYNYFRDKPQSGGPGVNKFLTPSKQNNSAVQQDTTLSSGKTSDEYTSKNKDRQESVGNKCCICHEKVYLLERCVESNKWYHRKCFWKSDLSPTSKVLKRSPFASDEDRGALISNKVRKIENEQSEHVEVTNKANDFEPDFFKRHAQQKEKRVMENPIEHCEIDKNADIFLPVSCELKAASAFNSEKRIENSPFYTRNLENKLKNSDKNKLNNDDKAAKTVIPIPKLRNVTKKIELEKHLPDVTKPNSGIQMELLTSTVKVRHQNQEDDKQKSGSFVMKQSENLGLNLKQNQNKKPINKDGLPSSPSPLPISFLSVLPSSGSPCLSAPSVLTASQPHRLSASQNINMSSVLQKSHFHSPTIELDQDLHAIETRTKFGKLSPKSQKRHLENPKKELSSGSENPHKQPLSVTNLSNALNRGARDLENVSEISKFRTKDPGLKQNNATHNGEIKDQEHKELVGGLLKSLADVRTKHLFSEKNTTINAAPLSCNLNETSKESPKLSKCETHKESPKLDIHETHKESSKLNNHDTHKESPNHETHKDSPKLSYLEMHKENPNLRNCETRKESPKLDICETHKQSPRSEPIRLKSSIVSTISSQFSVSKVLSESHKVTLTSKKGAKAVGNFREDREGCRIKSSVVDRVFDKYPDGVSTLREQFEKKKIIPARPEHSPLISVPKFQKELPLNKHVLTDPDMKKVNENNLSNDNLKNIDQNTSSLPLSEQKKYQLITDHNPTKPADGLVPERSLSEILKIQEKLRAPLTIMTDTVDENVRKKIAVEPNLFMVDIKPAPMKPPRSSVKRNSSNVDVSKPARPPPPVGVKASTLRPTRHHISIYQIQQELQLIDSELTKLELKGRTLEDTIRNAKDEVQDEFMISWFKLVNDKNELVRKEQDYIYLSKSQELELEQEQIDLQLHDIVANSGVGRIEDNQKVEHLLSRKIDVVNQRSKIVECIDEDRLRYLEEDNEIQTVLIEKGLLSNDGKDEVSKKFKKQLDKLS